MKTKGKPKSDEYEIPAEVDFSDGVRGAMAMRIAKRHNLKAILLDRELVKAFGSREKIEAALREYLAQKAKRRKTA